MKDIIAIACTHCGQGHNYRVNQLKVYFNKTFTTSCKKCGQRFPITVNSELFNTGSKSPARDSGFKTQIKSKGTQVISNPQKPITANSNKPYVVVKENEYCRGQKHQLQPGLNIIGRGPQSEGTENLITIIGNDKRMSRNHCKLMVEGDAEKGFKVILADAGSLNSTFLNGGKTKKEEEVYLLEKDSVRIGRTHFKIIFE